MTELQTECYRVVEAIPRGQVMTYGAVGRAMNPPATPRAVGRLMRFAPPEIPWWRVVGAGGTLPIAKIDPAAAQEQRIRLEQERVTFGPNGTILESHFFVY